MMKTLLYAVVILLYVLVLAYISHILKQHCSQKGLKLFLYGVIIGVLTSIPFSFAFYYLSNWDI